MKREIDTREIIKVVTKNDLIVADGLEQLSLNARKLLYLAIAQCRRGDTEFYEYSISPADLADMWGISRQRVYQKADIITDELMRMFLKISKKRGHFKKKHVFESCEYDDENMVTFELHRDMADMLLRITGDFTQPPAVEFMKMRSKYSMAIWHIMQREMHSTLPGISAPIEFELSLDELRKATGTESKLSQIIQFKKRVLDQAIKEIRKNLLADISYIDIKKGKKIVGFRFTAQNCLGVIDPTKIPLKERMMARKAELTRKLAEGTITLEERGEFQWLRNELAQPDIFDYMGKYYYSD